MEFKIIRVLKKKSEALEIKKNSIIQLRGKIKRIWYNSDSYTEKAEIIIE